MRSVALLFVAACVFASPVICAEPIVSFEHREGAIAVRLGDVDVVSYVYRDDQVPRPYFTHVKTPGGIQVTRHHPPRKEDDDTLDHAGLHTGIWLSFGDLNGCDYWRLKAKTEHIRFTRVPMGTAGRGAFAVQNRYLSTDGLKTICEEICHYNIRTIPGGYVIEMASEFQPKDVDLVFGDQEEMGLGIRLATPLAVDRKQGGRILDSAGRRNGQEVWGKTAEWCDYAGPLENKWVGMTVLSAPENFRPSWLHARDYGFLAVNPFGRHAFTKQEPSRVVVKPGDTLKLRFGVVVHEAAKEADFKPEEVYREFAR